jgi:sugar lactone lactonase YvrE
MAEFALYQKAKAGDCVGVSGGPDCVWRVGAELGEGPMWSAREQALWFVDIKGRKLHRHAARSGENHSWSAPDQPGFVVPTVAGDFMCGLKTGLHRFDPASGAFTQAWTVEPDKPGNRLNDACVDREGRLWFGSMDDGESKPTGAFYCLTDKGPERRDGPYAITNGPAVSPDGRTLYHIDTVNRVIYASDIHDDSSLSNKRVFATIDQPGAYPDGPVVDAEGCVWTGLWGGWCVVRHDPRGRLVQSVRLPCANVTKAAFGGADLRTLYVTTAWKGMSARDRADQPLAGCLFAVAVDMPGLPQNDVSHGV